jgi:hypothetical protein
MFRPSWVIIRALHGQNTKNYRLKYVCKICLNVCIEGKCENVCVVELKSHVLFTAVRGGWSGSGH